MMNFGGLDDPSTVYEKARFVVIPVPYDLTSTYQSGSRRGPMAIIEASCNMELYDEELGQETYRVGIHTLPFLEVDARGPAEMIRRVRESVGEVLAKGKFPVLLGGEHSITFGAVAAVQEIYPEIGVLQLDAHADLRDQYQGSPYSHAAVGRRVAEIAQLVQVGVRSMSVEESRFLREGKVASFSADFTRSREDWYKIICNHLPRDVYVTIDLDVLDPAFMPATGTPEPGGLTWGEILLLLKEVAKEKSIVGFDVVELAPLPGLIAPDFLASKLIYRLMGYLSQGSTI